MPQRHFYGWRPPLPRKFHRYPALKLVTFPPLSPAKDLITTGFLPPIWDQGQTSSCTGHGTTRGLMFARAKAGLPALDLSRLFPYYNARVAEGQADQDAGAEVGEVIVAVQQAGDCLYADLPTDPGLVTQPPSSTAIAHALAHKALTATRVLGATPASMSYHLRHCIDVLGLPVVFGFTVYESFESDEVAKSGIVPMPQGGESVLGGHCVVATGYDDATKLVTCDNSWNTTWGIQGRFKLPYAFIFDSDYASDFHAIQLAN